ncbi:MAG: aldehyde dehydrogenase family protein [Acetivibrionales bacterium]|jgi:acyl-CoA reductase-like NAD-dependent aldehyde dehydrogenase
MKMLIGGKWKGASDNGVREVINPATGEVIDTVPEATKEDVDEAIRLSLAGKEAWASFPLWKRAEILNKFVDMIDDNRKELGLLLSKEMGKPIKEAVGDFTSLKAIFTGFIETANNLLGNAMPIGVQPGKEKDLEITIREPLGTVVCIVPFNAPLVLFSHKVAPALIAGNAVIVKPASDNPLTLLRVVELMLKAGVPGDAVQILTGSGSKVGAWLTGDSRIAKVSFTGSTEVGLEIAQNAAKNLAHISLELGGNAPFIVLEDGDVDLAVQEAYLGRAAYVSGQICNVSKRFLIHRSCKEEFMNKLITKLKTLVIGDPLDENTQMGTLISERAAKEVEQQVAHTVEQGARLVYGGQRNGAFYTPAVLDGVTNKMDIAHNLEIFGPVFPIIEFDTIEEAISIANDTIYGLGASVFTRDMKKAMKIVMAMEAGSVIVNGNSFYRSLLMPFGGYKKSGIGREGLTATLQAVTQTKSVVFKNIL